MGGADNTRVKLLRVGAQLFARKGINGVTAEEIHRRAGAKNTSALHYYFGSQQGLLNAILSAHSEAIEARRGVYLDQLVANGKPDLRDIVRGLIEPQSGELKKRNGRAYLRIVPQITHLVGASWVRREAVGQWVRNVGMVEALLGTMPLALRRERITLMLRIITSEIGARAREIDEGEAHLLPHDAFFENLIESVVGGLLAPIPKSMRRPRRRAD